MLRFLEGKYFFNVLLVILFEMFVRCYFCLFEKRIIFIDGWKYISFFILLLGLLGKG